MCSHSVDVGAKSGHMLGVETLSKSTQKALIEKEIERKSCCDFVYIDSAFVHEDELP